MKKRIKAKTLAGTPFLVCEEQEIGKGSFGRVVRAYKRDEPTQELVAKIIPITQQNIFTIKSEIQIVKQIPHHENLVNYQKLELYSEHNFYFIMEYCNGGTFEKYIQKNNNCDQQIIWRFLKSFTGGYKVLYDAHLIHRDIKPENILIHNGILKIADFGFSKKMNHHSLIQNMSIKGTPLYIAPQLQEGVGSSKVDIFSLGIVLYRLSFNGLHPFYDQKKIFCSYGQYCKHVKATEVKFPSFPKRSDNLKKLILNMLEKNDEKRISWKQVFDHPKLKKDQQKKNFSKIQINQLIQLRKSIIQIGKSTASLKFVEEPFNFTGELSAELERLIQFTQYLPSLEVKGLQIFVARSKIIIELIKHLNANLKGMIQDKKNRSISKIFSQIIFEGNLYCQFQLDKIQKTIQNYLTEETKNEVKEMLLEKLENDKMYFRQQLQINKSYTNRIYEEFKYEGILYDYLTYFGELKQITKERLKIPTALMIDLYDGLLKLSSIVIFNVEGRIQLQSIQLEDAELDKIDYNNLNTYQIYLDSINDVTLEKVQSSLMSMGLIII